MTKQKHETPVDVSKDTAELNRLHKDFDQAVEAGDQARADADVDKAAGILSRDPAAMEGAK